MPYAITLRLDGPARVAVEAMWDRLARDGISSEAAVLGYPPHITLAVIADAADEAALIRALDQVTAGWTRRPVTFPGIGVFPGEPAVLWLAPVATQDLLSWHAAVGAVVPPGLLAAHYRRDNWVPHVTLADDLVRDAAPSALASVMPDCPVGAAEVTGVELVHFRPVSIRWRRDLGG